MIRESVMLDKINETTDKIVNEIRDDTLRDEESLHNFIHAQIREMCGIDFISTSKTKNNHNIINVPPVGIKHHIAGNIKIVQNDSRVWISVNNQAYNKIIKIDAKDIKVFNIQGGDEHDSVSQ